jgi:Ricin-type beta-trefoil lectin domain
MRRIAIVGGMVALVVGIGTGGAAVWARAEKHPFAHGINFAIKTAGNPNLCFQSQGDGSLLISACTSNHNNQRFALTDNPDGTNTIVDGYGECLDRGTGAVGTALVTMQCTFGATQRFKYVASSGHFKSPGATTCLAAHALQDAGILLGHCSDPSGDTVFGLSE